MATEVKLPRLGQGMESGTIVRWLKSEGEQVAKGEPLYEVDTEKVTQEVEAEADGVLLKIVVDLLCHLVGVELVERLALLDRLTLGLEPLHDRAGLHALAQPRQLDLGRHQLRATVRLIASSTSAACGTHHSSSFGANGSGANLAPTRSIGASR